MAAEWLAAGASLLGALSDGSKKSQSGTTTSKPYNPDWLEDDLYDSAKSVKSLYDKNPADYVSGPSSLQTQAFNGAKQLGNRFGFGSFGASTPTAGYSAPPKISQPATSSSLKDNLGVELEGVPWTETSNAFSAADDVSTNPLGGIGDFVQNTILDDWLGIEIGDGSDRARWGYAKQNVGLIDPTHDYLEYYNAHPEFHDLESNKYYQGFLKGFDFNGDGRLSPEEKGAAGYHTYGKDGGHKMFTLEPQAPPPPPPPPPPEPQTMSQRAFAAQRPYMSDRDAFTTTVSPESIPKMRNETSRPVTPAQVTPPATGYDPIAEYTDAADLLDRVSSSGTSTAKTYLVDDVPLISGNSFDAAEVDLVDSILGSSFDAAEVGDVADVRGVGEVNSARGIDYMDPYYEQYGVEKLLKPVLAEFDENAGRVRAQQAAQAAGNGAISGSRYAIREAITEELLSLQRATKEQELRIQALDFAAQNGQTDAQRVQAAREAEAARKQQALLANQAKEKEIALQNAVLEQQANEYAASSSFEADRTNQGVALTRALEKAGLEQQANQYAASSEFDANRTNQSALLEALLTNTAEQNATEKFNASQADLALERLLKTAGLKGDLASEYLGQERDTLALLTDLGAQERAIEQDQRTADLNLLDTILTMQGKIPLNLLSGSTNTTTSSGSTKPGLLDIANTVINGYGAYKQATAEQA